MDPAAVDLITLLITDRPGELYRGNAAKDLAAGTGLGADLQRRSFQHLDNLIDFRQELGFLLLQLFPPLFQLFQVGRIGFYR